MHYHITTKLGVDVKDSGFSLDELVYRMQELFHRQAFPELFAEILMMFDAYLRLNVERRTCREHLEAGERQLPAMPLACRARHVHVDVVRRLALGIACPRASSLIERTMRELARRLKRIAYGWKADGLNKVSKLLLKIFSNEDEWKRYWDERMSISNNVLLYFKMTKPAFVGA